MSNQVSEQKQPIVSALYARCSTARQEQEETIESQLAEVKSRIEADGNILPPENIYIDDGWTGEIMQRPSLDAMRDSAQEGNFQVLYVYDRGRLSRIFAHQELVLEELTDKGIKFISLHDVKAETAEEHVLQAMQGVFAEYERIKIVERMRRGKLYKARSGVLINGDALFGYKYIKKTDDIPAHYEINEEEARVVRMVFNWFSNDRCSLREIIRKLYDSGIQPRKKKSEFWTKGPLVRMLRHETYVSGIAYYNKSEAVVGKRLKKDDKYKKVKRNSRKQRPQNEWIPIKVMPLIEDRTLFQKAQTILDFNKKYARKNRKYDYLLSGLVYCECGNRRVGDGYLGNHYYRCAERIYKFPLEKKCTASGVNAPVLDGLFWRELNKYLNDPTLLRQNATEWLKTQSSHKDADEQEKNKIMDSLEKIREEEKRYAKAYGTGSLEFEQFKELIKETKRNKMLYQVQLNNLNSKIIQDNIDESELDELCHEAQEVIKEFDFTNKNKTIRDIIDKIVIYDKGKVEVNGHIPVDSNRNMSYEPISRDCWSSQCGEEHAV